MGCCQSHDPDHEKNIEQKMHGMGPLQGTRNGITTDHDKSRMSESTEHKDVYEAIDVTNHHLKSNSQSVRTAQSKDQLQQQDKQSSFAKISTPSVTPSASLQLNQTNQHPNTKTMQFKNGNLNKDVNKYANYDIKTSNTVESQKKSVGNGNTQSKNEDYQQTDEFKIGKGMVRISTQDILDSYIIGQVIGEGGFGTVCLVKHKKTQIERAMKMISKGKLNKQEEDKFFEELSILRQIDHACIVKVFEHFQDEKYHYLISEYCTGGELFERIKDVSPFTEKVAANYMKQILSAISYCHVNNIVHRDLKPENILFDSKAANSNLKVIDFGASTKFNTSEKLTKRIGTPFYVAPEILTKKPYDEKCDVWSLGVIMYILLCGYPPFWGQTDQEIYDKVKKGQFEFYAEDWAGISDEAKDLIKKMLRYDPADRISASEAYAHPWIVSNVHVEPLDDRMLKKLSQFAAKNKLRIAVLNLMANQVLNQNDKTEMIKHFESLDTNGDGMLSKEELISGYTKIMGDEFQAKQTVDAVFSELDLDGSGKVEFSEFLVASMQKEKVISRDKIEKAFKLIDTDGNGQITKSELEDMMGGLPLNEQSWANLIKECDGNNDGMISLNEFIDLLLNSKDLFALK